MNEHTPPASPDPQAPAARLAPYALRGQFLEVCDCHTICPCWTGRAPEEDVCTGVFAWVIEAGQIDGVDVAGQRAVSVSTHQGHRDNGHQRVMIFVGDEASDAQASAMAGAFSGRFGGPLGELATLLGELLAVERAPIDVSLGKRRATLSVGRRIAAEATSLVGPDGQATTLANARLSSVLGSPAEVGISQRFKVGLPGRGIDLDLRGRSAMRGAFDYRHAPAAP